MYANKIKKLYYRHFLYSKGKWLIKMCCETCIGEIIWNADIELNINNQINVKTF